MQKWITWKFREGQCVTGVQNECLTQPMRVQGGSVFLRCSEQVPNPADERSTAEHSCGHQEQLETERGQSESGRRGVCFLYFLFNL